MLSYHHWGFLNVSLVGEAWTVFDATEMENRLEVWRAMNVHTAQKTQADIQVLEDAVSANGSAATSRTSSRPWFSGTPPIVPTLRRAAGSSTTSGSLAA